MKYILLSISLLANCSMSVKPSLIGKWALLHSIHEKDVYFEIKFNENFSAHELIEGLQFIESQYNNEGNSINIGNTNYKYEFSSNDTLILYNINKKNILKRITEQDNLINNKSYQVRRFEYFVQNSKFLKKDKINELKDEMWEFFIIDKSKIPSEIDSLKDINLH